MAATKAKVKKRGTLLAGPRLMSDSDEGKIWRELSDQRRHNRAAVLKLLDAKKPEGRLKKFKQHGQFPRKNQTLRWITHDNKKLLCIEVSTIPSNGSERTRASSN